MLAVMVVLKSGEVEWRGGPEALSSVGGSRAKICVCQPLLRKTFGNQQH